MARAATALMWPFGDGPIGAWLERRRAFRDLNRAQALEAATLALRDDNPLNRAKVSVQVDDLKSAREFMAVARMRIPNYVLTSQDTVEILLALGEFAELESLMLEGARRFPREPHYLEGYALVAERQRHFEEAFRRWAVVRKKFPHRQVAHACSVACLRYLGRFDEAETLLRKILRATPNELPLLFEFARLAEARDDWEAAYRRWEAVRPRHPAGFYGAALALQKLGRIPDAEALLAEGRRSHPIYPSFAILLAHIAAEAGDTAEALKRWTLVRDRFPFEQAGYVEATRILSRQQRWEEADAIALAAIDRFHAHAWPLAEYAMVADTRKDWAEAAKRWAALRTAFPDRTDAAQRETAALAAAARQPADTKEKVTSQPPS
jgi:tetratricopeptide (TPR) repeat protein